MYERKSNDSHVYMSLGKPNGEVCESVVECGVQGAICVDECKCDEDEYLDIICKPSKGYLYLLESFLHLKCIV